MRHTPRWSPARKVAFLRRVFLENKVCYHGRTGVRRMVINGENRVWEAKIRGPGYHLSSGLPPWMVERDTKMQTIRVRLYQNSP